MQGGRRFAFVVMALFASSWVTQAAAQPNATDKQKVGFTDLINRLGAAAPTGAGVTVSQIEANENPAPRYVPNATHADFAGKTITVKSGASSNSSHATSVGRNFYGSGSFAPGIRTIDAYMADDWIANGGLRTLQSGEPTIETRRVQNSSWIGSVGSVAADTDALRRLDYLIDRDNVVVACGVNNGVTSGFPPLLSNAYNAVVVGRTDGLHTAGPTNTDIAGRVKPDLVAPAINSSLATAWVSSSAGLLVETAGANAEAARAETIKASLLSGATKTEFDLDNTTGSTFDNWSRTATRPLDLRYGAGELNIDNSHRILSSLQQEASASSLVSSTGWDFDDIGALEHNLYFFDVPMFAEVSSLSIVAAWNRRIAFTAGQGGAAATFTPSLANIDLKLSSATGFTVGTQLDQSISTIDNVEHLFQRNLGPGRYVIDLSSNLDWEVALAWDAIMTLTVVPGDGNGDRCVTGADYTIWADGFGLFNGNATPADGDYSGDGFVTGADYTVWADHFGICMTPADAGIQVPEPATAVTGIIGIACLALFAGRCKSSRAIQRRGT